MNLLCLQPTSDDLPPTRLGMASILLALNSILIAMSSIPFNFILFQWIFNFGGLLGCIRRKMDSV